jgi:hypothetical protein
MIDYDPGDADGALSKKLSDVCCLPGIVCIKRVSFIKAKFFINGLRGLKY